MSHGVVVLESVITAVLGTLFYNRQAAIGMLDECTEEVARRLTEMFK